jgi:outer membrane immunogenic protein
MKKLAIAIAVAGLIGTPAIAADMYVKAPVYVPPSWTGFYYGANLGGTWSDEPINVSTTNLYFCPLPVCSGGSATAQAAAQGSSGIFSGRADGLIGGGQFGYNWQLAPTWVAGFETDIQGIGDRTSGASGVTVPTAGFPGVSVTTNLSVDKEVGYLGTVRGRLGWLASPALLVYGTGGLVYGGVKAATNVSSILTGYAPGALVVNPGTGSSLSETRAGWTAGAGFEWKATSQWSVKLEYLYYDLGTVTTNSQLVDPLIGFPVPNYFVNNVQTTTRFNGNIVRVGLNYKFDWGVPVITR